MVKKNITDKNLIKELTNAIKELIKVLKENNLNYTSEKKSNIGSNEIKRVKIDHQNAMLSPMVGTVYLSPEPGSKPFIKQDQKIKKGDTVLIIEAMKTFNNVRAPRSGVIKKILITSGKPAEYGEKLMIIE